MPARILIGLPAASHGGRIDLARRMSAGLSSVGHEVGILLLGRDEDGVAQKTLATSASMAPAFDTLPVGPDDTLPQQWETLERYLEERAPCVSIMWPGTRLSHVAARLSNRVRVLCMVESDAPIDSGEIARLGPFCNAIVAVGERIHFNVLSRIPYLAARTFAIGETRRDDESRGDDRKSLDIVGVVAQVEERARLRVFIRRRVDPGWLDDGLVHGPAGSAEPPRVPDSLDGTVPWPEGLAGGGRSSRGVAAPAATHAALESHRVLVAYSPGTISGVDVFAEHLVRGLRERGIDARLHGRASSAADGRPSPPLDLPLDERDPSFDADYLGWPNRWRGMIAHLARLAPCIYVPNYDSEFSAVCPQLPEGVRVVGIGHSDDPWHYEHLSRIGPACDAIVGVSESISGHLRSLAPDIASRVETIPYGIPSHADQTHDSSASPVVRVQPTTPNIRLRIIYAGRLVIRQKRVLDLVAIARALDARGVPFEMTVVGDGDDRGVMERAALDLIPRRRLWFTAGQPNSTVHALLEECDVFLLPSAFEGLSVGMLEAMSRGVVPVVSAIRSGVPDVIASGANGLVAPVGDIAAFADRLEWLWKHPAERGRLAAAAMATVDSGYRLHHMVDRYIDLFRRIIAAPIARPIGPIAPPRHLEPELTWSLWASRVAADPVASVRRVARRFTHPPP
jgi:glycosyltransferase involved in cell wall biosynthesis